MGCAGRLGSGAATQAQLTLDANDKIWKGTYTLPAGPYAYKVAINKAWDENYGAGRFAERRQHRHHERRLHRSRSSTTTARIGSPRPPQGAIVVAPGSFQSEMGCAGDWDPACMRSWLQDPDGDGTFTLSTTQIPAGVYEGKVAINRTWDENYGQGGVPNGANIPFTVPEGDGMVTTFSYDSATHVLTRR